MPFYLRKSVKMGPFRLNLSKSGLGVSFGVTGARVSTGPRGTFVNVGRGGVYYRQRLDGSSGEPPPSGQPSPDASADHQHFESISADDVIADVNRKASLTPLAPLVGIGGVLAGAVSLGHESALVVVGILTAILFAFAYNWDVQRRWSEINFEFDQASEERFAQLGVALETLSRSSRLWYLTGAEHTADWKRNAGATALVSRQPARMSQTAVPFVNTNVPVWALECGSVTLYFLPDRLLIRRGREYRAAAYTSLGTVFTYSQFRENETVPPDAEVVGYAWQYTRKDGGPDGRFANNRQIPIVKYGQLSLQIADFRIDLQLSDPRSASQFVAWMSNGASRSDHDKRGDTNQTRTRSGTDASPSQPLTAYAILGVTPGASPEEITAAYRRMAQLYHPDKVATLGPELKSLAEQKMRDINEAYQVLRPRQQ